MNELLNVLASEQSIGYLTSFIGGSGAVGLGIAKKLGLKPASLISSLFRRKKNPLKELFDVIRAIRDGKPKDKIADEVIDVIEALKPMLKEKK